MSTPAPLVDRVGSAFESLRPGRSALSASARILWLAGYSAGLIFRIVRAARDGPLWVLVAVRLGFRDAVRTHKRRDSQ